MIHSMTGYGSAQRSEDGVWYALELRSVNNRYFKASIRLPEFLQFLESDVEKLLRARIHRGSVTFLLRVRDESDRTADVINRAALQSYLDSIDLARVPEGVSASVDLATLLTLPGVCQVPDLDDKQRRRFWHVIEALAAEAMETLLDMRRREGEALRKDLLLHCNAMREHLAAIETLAPTVPQEYQTKLRERANTLLSSAELTVDEDRLLRELAVFADRCDISEEIARVKSHLDQFVHLCDDAEHAGRKLDFLAQELLREANTISSKSNNTAIIRHIVETKGLIGRLKEQVQNAE